MTVEVMLKKKKNETRHSQSRQCYPTKLSKMTEMFFNYAVQNGSHQSHMLFLTIASMKIILTKSLFNFN